MLFCCMYIVISVVVIVGGCDKVGRHASQKLKTSERKDENYKVNKNI